MKYETNEIETMKKLLLILAVAGVASVLNVLAASGPGPGGPGDGTNNVNTFSNYYNWNRSWSNYLNQAHDYQWGTNLYHMTNAPAPNTWSNAFQRTYGGPGQTDPGQMRNRFGQPELPADVQACVQQFQQDRQRLMNQLKTCSDAQRQQILQEMEQLRTRLREQVVKFRDQAQQQATQMRDRLNNDRSRMLQNGGGNNGTGGRDR